MIETSGQNQTARALSTVAKPSSLALFDADWYRARYPDVATSGIDPLQHYLDSGAEEGRDPNPLFHTIWYLDQNPDVRALGINPLLHYLETGAAEGRDPHPLFDVRTYRKSVGQAMGADLALADFLRNGWRAGGRPHPLFDTAWYLAGNPDVVQAGLNPLLHYLSLGGAEGRSPHPLFDAQWYCAQNPEIACTGANPLLHYLTCGAAEGRDPNPLFDGLWYRARYPDARPANLNPLIHYVEVGVVEGRDPHPLFDAQAYLRLNTDVAAAAHEPLTHFLHYGGLELRDPHPLFSSRWYASRVLKGNIGEEIPILHYLRTGAAEGRDPNPLFDSAWYGTRHPDVRAEGVNPLIHYVGTSDAERGNPHPLFDTTAYLARNPDVAAGGSEALSHFLHYGGPELRDPHPLFSSRWYAEQNPDLQADAKVPVLHYLQTGASEGRDPNPFFNGEWYRSHFLELQDSDINPLIHYIEIGAGRGHDPGPDFDATWYANAHGVNGVPLEQPLAHYLTVGQQAQEPVKPIHARHQIAVVFLARSAEGSTAGFTAFLRTYRNRTAGVPHDLIVLRKGGTRKPGAREALALMLDGLMPQYIDLDDRGYDIQAYLRASAILPHEYVCFLNSHSEIMADDWLRKIYDPLCAPNIGIVGATASYESITDTIDLGTKATWLAERGRLSSDPETVALFSAHLDKHVPGWRPGSLAPSEQGSVATCSLDEEISYARDWSARTRPGGNLYPLGDFRRFPNPHIRTNGFIMRRSVLLSLGIALDDTKMACVRFESGPGGLPDLLATHGLESILVGADGSAFEVERWAESDTFRLNDQNNILIRDNRVIELDTFESGERQRYVHFTWGEYAGPTPEVLVRLGFPFAKGKLQREFQQSSNDADGPPTIAIAIPSHGRMDLVRDALTTIVGQSYPHWTCVVFDNASPEPVAEMVAAFREPRITYARSDNFLPVTDSWNRAIDLARGDYVLLLGDDDGLTPDSLEILAKTIHDFEKPDIIYTALYQFFHPGVAPWEPSGYVSRRQNGFFFDERTEPFRLDPAAASLAVAGSLALRRNFTYNMQAFFFRKPFLDYLRRNGSVFQSPFPDYYLANIAFALAKDIIVMPEPICIQGVSRKSFGFTLLNNDEVRGDSLLATDLCSDPLFQKVSAYKLPGPTYDLKYVITMEHVISALGEACPKQVDVGRYRRLQIFKALGGLSALAKTNGVFPDSIRDELLPQLSEDEATWAFELLRLGQSVSAGDQKSHQLLAKTSNDVAMYAPAEQAVIAHSGWAGDFANLPELFRAMRNGRIAAWVKSLTPENADRA